jgi:CBS domain-containing protein
MDAALRLAAAKGAPRAHSKLPGAKPSYVRRDDPAVKVMTDFTHEIATTIGAERRLDDALDVLFRSNVRVLLVTSGQQVMGLVTVRDLRGERIAHSDYRAWRNSLRVADVMTSVSDMPTIDWHTVLESTVGDLAEILQNTNIECLVVIESEGRSLARIRGLIHRGRLERQMKDYAG